MELIGNIFPPVSKLMSHKTGQALMPIPNAGQGGFEFHSLIKGQVKLELFHGEPIPPGSPEIQQYDQNGWKETKGDEPDRKFDLTRLSDIPVTETVDLFNPAPSSAMISDVPLSVPVPIPVPVQVGFEPVSEPVSASTSVQIRKPELSTAAGPPLLLQAKIEQPIKSFVSSNLLENERQLSANNTVTDLKAESAKVKIEPGIQREIRAQAIGVGKDQPTHLTVEIEEANAIPNRAVEQKSVVVPSTVIITKAIVQNIQAQRADASQNILSVLAQNKPRSFQSIEVQLVPKNLGIVELKISHSNRHLSIVVETKTKEAESLLRSEITAISKSLGAAGLSMDEITIRFNPRLEQIDSRDLRFVDTGFDKTDSENFDSKKNQHSGEELGKNEKFQHLTANKNSESNQRVSSNSAQRRGIYM